MLGIDKLTHLVRLLDQKLTTLITAVLPLGGLPDAIRRMENRLNDVPTREEFDQAKAALGQAISDAATRITTDLQELRDQIAAGNPVTDQDLADIQADTAALGNLDPAAVPAPSP